ncbi:uncharacterized protein Dyak_GE29237, partial [Drosophila yakuba]
MHGSCPPASPSDHYFLHLSSARREFGRPRYAAGLSRSRFMKASSTSRHPSCSCSTLNTLREEDLYILASQVFPRRATMFNFLDCRHKPSHT